MTKYFRVLLSVSLFGFLGGVAMPAHAQVTTATIYGSVADPTGAIVPSAKVSATNELTGARQEATTNELGEFTFTFLPVGRYTLNIESQGFRPVKQTGLELTAGQQLRLNLSLQLGSSAEVVSVTAETPLINAVSAEQRTTIDKTQAVELPLARRNWTGLLNLNTGIEGTRLNGLPGAGFRFTVDGTDSEGDPEFPSIAMYLGFNFIQGVSLEAVSEVNLAKGIASAEIANTMSGNINVTTRGGTNEFHGSLFLNNQVENLAARNQFLATRTPLVFNQFGGALGGPIVKNRLFFFGVFEGYRQRAFRPLNGNVPTQEFRDQAIRAVPAYKPYFDRFPVPNTPTAAGAVVGFFQGAGSNAANDNHANVRVDYRIGDRSNLSARYSRGRPDQVNPRITANPQEFTGINEVGTMSFTHARSSWTGETRFGYNKNDVSRVDKIYGDGIPGITCCLGFSDAGETLFKGGTTKSFEQIIAMTRGRHSIKFGGLYSRRDAGRDNIEVPQYQYANVDDFLNNRANVAQFTYGVNPFLMKMWQLGFFVQDDFKVSRRLILNLGIRNDYMSVPVERDNRLFNRDEPFGFGALRPADSIYNADRLNLSPRVGFAYSLDENSRTVIRGGAGFFHSPHTLFGGPVELVRNAIDEPNRHVFSRAEIERFGVRYPANNATTLPLIKSPNFPWSNTSISPNFPNPYSIQWTLSVQREITRNGVFESSYVANRGLKLNMVRDQNQVNRVTGARPTAGFGTFRYYDPSDASTYQSWQNSFRRRFANGLLFNLNYTWARNISLGDGDLLLPTSRPQDINNLRLDRGPSAQDINHRFVSDFLYELPFLKFFGKNSRAGILLFGGWQVGGVFNARTGAPLYVTQPSAIPGSRPDYIGGATVNENYRDTLQYLNTSAFVRIPVIAASGATERLGNLGRNALRGPGSINTDLSLSKNLAFNERWRLQLRGDLFNAFNQTYFTGVSTSIIQPNFGRVTAANARVVQINARLSF